MVSTYAVLGVTGNCGSSLVQVLLQSSDTRIHAYCRNKAKLHHKLPEVVGNDRVEVFEGGVHNVELLAQCVRNCRAAFLVVTMNENLPGCCVAQDTARSLITALKGIKTETDPSPIMPKLVVLSSTTIDPHLSRKMPWWFHPIMIRAGSYVYEDLRVQEKFLRSQEDWISTIFIKPGGLAVDKARGHKLDFDEENSFIAYLGLAGAMVEAANDPDNRYDMRNVSVVNTGGSAKFPAGTPLCILSGLLSHYFPSLHSYLPKSGP
ncbi:OrdB protein [Nannizzia gypsea CBS 118893]|uniref:OrdB protein n=1 Tax=Arthroderma gypseum (strain ATCC MYA-4604 / CBS 118893) TaxID=535722 RepID=E4V647_ARTGP|nr:OrdB protein [Nannizzia gypsea CBS 118893]EFR05230.1 OrdB protein [Nannizzia gypsea CBS 118893]